MAQSSPEFLKPHDSGDIPEKQDTIVCSNLIINSDITDLQPDISNQR